jgi:disulfide bond formation protein DsbB
MTAMSISAIRPHPALTAALIVAAGGIATILGAYFFQYVLEVQPCDLCLLQRKVYYVGIPLALIVAFVVSRDPPRSVVIGGLGLLAVAMLIGTGIATYHSGVEWKFWPGPQDCTGDLTNFGGAGRSILDIMDKTKLVRCDQATRYFGVSLANCNVVISFALAAVAVWGVRAEWAKRRM